MPSSPTYTYTDKGYNYIMDQIESSSWGGPPYNLTDSQLHLLEYIVEARPVSISGVDSYPDERSMEDTRRDLRRLESFNLITSVDM